MMANPVNEPSMEQILASIRQIIAEGGHVRPPETPEEPIAEGRGADMTNVTDMEDRRPASDRAPQTLNQGPPSAAPATAPATPPAPSRPAVRAPQGDLSPILVAPREAAEATRSFARLRQSLNPADAANEEGTSARDPATVTLERLAGDLLRPMLKQWLDQRLPGLVEQLVRDEIERLATQSRPRDG